LPIRPRYLWAIGYPPSAIPFKNGCELVSHGRSIPPRDTENSGA
jgi:hypothetical protein